MCNIDDRHLDEYPYHPIAEQKFIEGAYCGIDANNDLVTKPNYSWTMNKDIRPATKEQSDLLSQKLKEAGYGIG